MGLSLIIKGEASVRTVAQLIQHGANVKAASDEVCCSMACDVKTLMLMVDAAKDERVHTCSQRPLWVQLCMPV